ncbi:hypothetical protein SacxiDRAFT_1900 [Saccharomonospora xinjiangensis XJ-54]|uniref:Uncharacterized protein n=1 Tax=Saccharomonospora xinjiangensis XJ-54 TaxID=882086 RepID=I0V1Y5_9PSEU|nr:hypothetical protein SacxiDRAFT_1900 [Saccharomonospora xinjiangensis XJ-54]
MQEFPSLKPVRAAASRRLFVADRHPAPPRYNNRSQSNGHPPSRQSVSPKTGSSTQLRGSFESTISTIFPASSQGSEVKPTITSSRALSLTLIETRQSGVPVTGLTPDVFTSSRPVASVVPDVNPSPRSTTSPVPKSSRYIRSTSGASESDAVSFGTLQEQTGSPFRKLSFGPINSPYFEICSSLSKEQGSTGTSSSSRTILESLREVGIDLLPPVVAPVEPVSVGLHPATITAARTELNTTQGSLKPSALIIRPARIRSKKLQNVPLTILLNCYPQSFVGIDQYVEQFREDFSWRVGIHRGGTPLECGHSSPIIVLP